MPFGLKLIFVFDSAVVFCLCLFLFCIGMQSSRQAYVMRLG